MSLSVSKSEVTSQKKESTQRLSESENNAPHASSEHEHASLQPKPRTNEPFLVVPLPSAFARSSSTFSDISSHSADNEIERRTGRLLNIEHGSRLSSRSPAPPTTWTGRFAVSWVKNKGLALVMLSQLFGVMMNVTTRLLEMDGPDGPGMHPFQVSPKKTGSLLSMLG